MRTAATTGDARRCDQSGHQRRRPGIGRTAVPRGLREPHVRGRRQGGRPAIDRPDRPRHGRPLSRHRDEQWSDRQGAGDHGRDGYRRHRVHLRPDR